MRNEKVLPFPLSQDKRKKVYCISFLSFLVLDFFEDIVLLLFTLDLWFSILTTLHTSLPELHS